MERMLHYPAEIPPSPAMREGAYILCGNYFLECASERGGENAMRRFSDVELKILRNDVPVQWVIETLLRLPHKEVEGVYRFLCPLCNEFQTGINPNTNLARCFRCGKNLNPIELVMVEKELSFVQSVRLLEAYASRCQAAQTSKAL